MSNLFGGISDIKVDLPNRTATFSFEEVKISMHDSIMEVEHSLNSLFHYFQAIDQLDAVLESIQESKGEVSPAIMQLVNQDNQLGKLFGIYIPKSLRYEMDDSPIDAMNKKAAAPAPATNTPNNTSTTPTATADEKKETGTTITEKAKGVMQKTWEVVKAFFAKIAQSLKSFWQWLKNGFNTNSELNKKLEALIKADTSGELTSAALKKAIGFLPANQAEKFGPVTTKILSAPFLMMLNSTNCSDVMKQMDAKNIWNMDATGLLGINEELLKDDFILFTAASGTNLLPTLAQDKEGLNALKANKQPMEQLGWTKDLLLRTIVNLNEFYALINKGGIPLFVTEAPNYNWETSEYVKSAQDQKQARNRVQAVTKFFAQICKVFVSCGNVPQLHLTAISKFMKAEPGSNPQQPTASVQPLTQAQP